MRFTTYGLMVLMGCAGGGEPADLDDEAGEPSFETAHFAGVNGDVCVASPFNCRFRDGSSRVTTAGGDDSWGIDPGASIRDGNGDVLLAEAGSRLTFNYGQTRALAGKAHALALTTSNHSAGWYPIDHILGETSFRARVGEVNAKNPGLGAMACYAVRNAHDPALELKKVVFDSMAGPDGHERAGDYLSLVRVNGRRSVNLIFSVPGFGLGGATTDHFPAGTKFQRVKVPTTAGNPSITIPLWVQDGEGRYRTQSGTMLFLYGHVRAADGTRRFGWMARDALEVSADCP
ncbi:MAG: hypothetical protein E6J90_20995 [Deltaproteobacteria bacterium]|nr:MAG: hypothetical protein E6J91_15495 [Deltaproteobacteria bacterium]TMQ18077.1 MAG: hypothetical protein E6J90_20995 [Deltaproteobacteria bacterium]